ncbi:MAG: tail fiber domain-containing protein [Thermodesulfovibrionales bacterium]|jgi:hypothetical protein
MASGAYVSTGGVWTNASSREYKENIRDLTVEEVIQALEGFNPVKFNYKTDQEDKHIGFLAEDVPDLVATKDRKGVSPIDLMAVLTEVVQEQKQTLEQKSEVIEKQQQSIEAQQKAFADLAATVTQMKEKIQRLESVNMTAITIGQY